MNRFFTASVLALLALSTGMLRAQTAQPDNFLPERNTATGDSRSVTIKYTLLQPDDKTSEIVKAEERNPFAKLNDDKDPLNAKGSNEETIIRGHLEKLRVVGASPGPNGLRVMLGDMVLECGQNVPPVIADQSLNLRVGAISPTAIELVWVEKKPSALPPRKLTIPVELRPAVRYLLPGQGPPSSSGEKNTLAKIGQRPLGSQILEETSLTTGRTKTPATPPRPVAKPARATAPLPAPTADAKQPAPKPAATAEIPNPGSDPAPAKPAASKWAAAAGFLNELAKLKNGKPTPDSEPPPVPVEPPAPPPAPAAKPSPPATKPSAATAIPAPAPVPKDLPVKPEPVRPNPPEWEAAVGLLNNLAKLEDAKNP